MFRVDTIKVSALPDSRENRVPVPVDWRDEILRVPSLPRDALSEDWVDGLDRDGPTRRAQRRRAASVLRFPFVPAPIAPPLRH